MDNKRYTIAYLILTICVVLTLFLSGCSLKSTSQKNLVQPQPSIVPSTPKITLTMDFGDNNIATYSGIEAQNVYEALTKVSGQQTLEVKTKQYSFGLLVESIGDKNNTANKAWQYYVNAKLGDKSSDKFELKDKDEVLWRYENPNF